MGKVEIANGHFLWVLFSVGFIPEDLFDNHDNVYQLRFESLPSYNNFGITYSNYVYIVNIIIDILTSDCSDWFTSFIDAIDNFNQQKSIDLRMIFTVNVLWSLVYFK